MEYQEAVAYLKSQGWVVDIQTPSPGGIDVATVWRRGESRIVTVWYPGRGQYELFVSTPESIGIVACRN